MIDLREHKAAILDGLRDVREKDENWGWSLRSVSKHKALIRWGYLDSIGWKGPISIRVEVDDDEPMICARMDDRYQMDYLLDDDADPLVVLIGKKMWHDADNVDDGLRILVRNIGYVARTRY